MWIIMKHLKSWVGVIESSLSMLAMPQMNSASVEIKIGLLCDINFCYKYGVGMWRECSKLISGFIDLEVTLFIAML